MDHLDMDVILMEIMKEKKTIAGFFDAIFGFLRRNTDFYLGRKDFNDKCDSTTDTRAQSVLAAMQRYESACKLQLQNVEDNDGDGNRAPPAIEEIEVETESPLEMDQICPVQSSAPATEWPTALLRAADTNCLLPVLEQAKLNCQLPDVLRVQSSNSASAEGVENVNKRKDIQKLCARQSENVLYNSPVLRKILPKTTSGTDDKLTPSPSTTKRPHRVYKCSDCPEVFPSFRQLKRHEPFHMPSNAEGISICGYCCSLYANAETLEKHMDDCHAGGKKHLCVPCQKYYNSRGHLLKHVLSSVHNASALLYYCSLCPRSSSAAEFSSRLALQQHFQETHLLMPSTQEEDDVEIEMNEEFLDEFLLNNTNENSFHFSECWDALDLHLPDMLHLQSTGSNNTGDQPVAIAFKCPKCLEGCASQKALLQHMAHKHALRVLICNQCEISFHDHAQLMRHKAAHRAHATTESSAATTKDERVCGVCDRSFASKAALNYHIKTHSRSSMRPHECPYCGKCFRMETNFKQHLRIVHTQTKRHTCELCDKQFATLDHLKKHVLSQHQNERKHDCHVCSKRFTQLCHLKQHLVIHTTGKTLRCSFCEASFWRKIDLERHTLTKHVQE